MDTTMADGLERLCSIVVTVPVLPYQHEVACRAEAQSEGQIVAIRAIWKRSRQFKAQARGCIPILTDMDNGYAMSLNLAHLVLGEDGERDQRANGAEPASPEGKLRPLPTKRRSSSPTTKNQCARASSI